MERQKSAFSLLKSRNIEIIVDILLMLAILLISWSMLGISVLAVHDPHKLVQVLKTVGY